METSSRASSSAWSKMLEAKSQLLLFKKELNSSPLTGFLKVYVSYVSQSNFCQLFFCEKNPIIGRYGLQPSQVGWGSCERKTGSFTSPRSCCKKKRNRNKWEKQTSIDTNTESQSRHSHCVLAGFYLRWAMAKHGQAELRKKLTTLATWLLLEIG